MSIGWIVCAFLLLIFGEIRRRLRGIKCKMHALQFLLALLLLTTSQNLSAESHHNKGLGLKPLEQKHFDHIQKNLHWVIEVKPNQIGAARIHEHLKNNGHEPIEISIAESVHEEFISTKGRTEETIAHWENAHLNATPLPSHVDNSTLPSFPPIGDQGQLGSCVAWGSTYYQTTHEVGLLNGFDNKTSDAKICSPKWTYNLLNGGFDDGLNPLDAFFLLSQNGAASLQNFPYDDNYLAWDLHSQDWISAISARTTSPQVISGIGGTQPQNLQLIKQILNNGHVLTFATFVESWVYTTVKKDPSASSNPYAGQQAVSWMNGTDGGHFITIVGYDDNVWIDVNRNGKVDAGEKGAFLIANSWSTDWGNKGFIWISYDAFRAVSAVHNGPSTNRVPLADALDSNVISIVPKAAGYSPKLVAEFSLSQAVRNQISIGSGVSTTTQTSPSQVFSSGALTYQGGPYEFNGTASGASENATFAVDLTDLLSPSSTPQRFYLLLSDNKAGHPTTLTSFSLLDFVNQQQINCTNVPITCDNSKVSAYIDYAFPGEQHNNSEASTISSYTDLGNYCLFDDRQAS